MNCSVITASDGASIAYEVNFAGAPWQRPQATLLMHHGVGFNRDAWALWLPKLLAAGYRVVRLDMRGHGASTKPEPGYDWTTERFVADVNDVLDAEGIVDSHFVGESWGGTVGLAWAAAFPGRARTISVMSTTYNGALVPRIDGFPKLIRDKGIEAWAETMNEARFFPSVGRDILDWAYAAQCACPGHVVSDIFRYILKQDLSDQLASITAPVMILAPQSSPFVKFDLAIDLKERLSNVELLTFPGHRHGLVLSGSTIACDAMTNFHARHFHSG
ncbi:MAG: alpha/beta hydrolase [Rhizobiaceae bacterium]